MSTNPILIKPGITAAGFRTAVRDYTEPTVVEELAANSYDADASTVLVLLDTSAQHLYVIDDGSGFSEEAIRNIATLGGGDKQEIPSSLGDRHFLGSYGYGLKSSLNIASKVEVMSYSGDRAYKVTLDWSRLDDALKADFSGYTFENNEKPVGVEKGTVIKLVLKNPTQKNHLDGFGEVLANLPNDEGGFACYYGLFDTVRGDVMPFENRLRKLRALAEKLRKKGRLQIAGTTLLTDLTNCEKEVIVDKDDKNVSGTFYFTGLDADKVRHLKPGLRGIYIRIHGRLLKQSFTDRKFTYNISKWVKFESGLRVELSVDWLRDQISLSREGIRFANPKLESDFKSVLTRLVSRFIQPRLKTLEGQKSRVLTRQHKQRMEIARKRSEDRKDLLISGVTKGFNYKPETDGELALLLAQDEVLKRVCKDFILVDYNEQAPFDAIFFDQSRRDFVFAEFEPTLMEFLDHKEKEQVQSIFVWALSKWRVGAKKRGKGGYFELITASPPQKGLYRLLEHAGNKSKKPRKSYSVFVVEDLI